MSGEDSTAQAGFRDDMATAETRSQAARVLIGHCLEVNQIVMKFLTETIPPAHHRADPIPSHPTILTGQMWVLGLLKGHPDRIRCELGVHKHVFRRLVDELELCGLSCSEVTLEEQLAIFLYTCVTSLSCTQVGKRFQRPNNIISKYFRKILNAFSSATIYAKYVRLPRADAPTPSRITHDATLYPYFKDAIGAIDGTHFACIPSTANEASRRNRMEFHSQNCLVGCNFNLEFVYVLSGWEGSVANVSIYRDARTKGFTVPAGKYYLADAGYPICSQLLVPYRGIGYHSPEQGRAHIRTTNSREYFNLRHARLRNVIERMISALKRRFRILVIPPEYGMDIQARIPAALCCIHNFIRHHDPEDLKDITEEAGGQVDNTVIFGTLAEGFITEAERDEMTAKRDEIANER